MKRFDIFRDLGYNFPPVKWRNAKKYHSVFHNHISQWEITDDEPTSQHHTAKNAGDR